MLPAAGNRDLGSGGLNSRGYGGNYWSSTENNNSYAYYLLFGSSVAFTFYYNRTYGFSVRCIAE